MTIDTENTDVTGNENDNSDSTGAVVQTEENAPATQADEKRFSQAEIDRIVKERLAEDRKRRDKDFEKKTAELLADKDAEFEKLVQERVETALTLRELETARASIAQEYGLNETQAARLQGQTIDELRADAETLYAALRLRKAPQFNTGSTKNIDPVDDDPIRSAIVRGAERAATNRRRY